MRIKDLYETTDNGPPLPVDLTHTLPPTFIMPTLQNNDSYKQYRYSLALATAQAVAKKEVIFTADSTWNENTAVVCYVPEEEAIVRMANKLMGVPSVEISKTPSHEQPDVNKTSPIQGLKYKFD